MELNCSYVAKECSAHLVDNIESWHDVPMHKAGGAPDPRIPMEVHMERNFENVYQFYLEYPWLAEHTPSSFAEEHALAKLLGCCGLFEECAICPGVFCLTCFKRLV